MADFSVKFENMKACQAAIDNCGDIVKRSISNVSGLKNRIPDTVLNSLNIRRRLTDTIDRLRSINNRFGQLSEGIETVTQKYVQAEIKVIS